MGRGATRRTQTKILRKILLTTLCTSVDQTVTQDHLLPGSTTVRYDMWTTIFSKDLIRVCPVKPAPSGIQTVKVCLVLAAAVKPILR